MEHHKARLEQFSDGVFAIAITLLALELKVPHLVHQNFGKSLGEILPLLPTVFAFILSFMTIAIFWVNHQELCKSLRESKRRVLWGNMLLLLFISLIPFATEVVGENTFFPLAVCTYSAILFGASTIFSVLRYWVHVGKHNARSVRRSFVGPVFYALAIISSLFFIPLAFVFLAIPPFFYFIPRSASEA